MIRNMAVLSQCRCNVLPSGHVSQEIIGLLRQRAIDNITNYFSSYTCNKKTPHSKKCGVLGGHNFTQQFPQLLLHRRKLG